MKLFKVAEGTLSITMESVSDGSNLSESMILTSLKSTIATNNKFKEVREDVAIRFTKRGKKKTKVDLVTRIKLGNGASEEATKLEVSKHLDEAVAVQVYFCNLVTFQ